jgi:hypothetical protein
MATEYFFECEEQAQTVAGILAEQTSLEWRMEKGDAEWRVYRMTTEDEIRWLPAGVGDVADWLTMSMDAATDHRDDVTELAQPGDTMADWRAYSVRLGNVVETATGNVLHVEMTFGRGDTRRLFDVQIWEKAE